MSQDQQITDEATVLYQQQLHPWCIIQQLPHMQNRTLSRFRRRNDADAHLRVLRSLAPTIKYELIFDSSSGKKTESKDSSRKTPAKD